MCAQHSDRDVISFFSKTSGDRARKTVVHGAPCPELA
jgi:hypothetical protein